MLLRRLASISLDRVRGTPDRTSLRARGNAPTPMARHNHDLNGEWIKEKRSTNSALEVDAIAPKLVGASINVNQIVEKDRSGNLWPS